MGSKSAVVAISFCAHLLNIGMVAIESFLKTDHRNPNISGLHMIADSRNNPARIACMHITCSS